MLFLCIEGKTQARGRTSVVGSWMSVQSEGSLKHIGDGVAHFTTWILRRLYARSG
jgi:hypothetical protein